MQLKADEYDEQVKSSRKEHKCVENKGGITQILKQ